MIIRKNIPFRTLGTTPRQHLGGSGRPVISDIIFGSRPAASILCATDRYPCRLEKPLEPPIRQRVDVPHLPSLDLDRSVFIHIALYCQITSN